MKSTILTICLCVLAFAIPAVSQTRLEQLAEMQSQQWAIQRAIAESLAHEKGIPIRVDQPFGRSFELQRFVNGRPLYYTTFNLNAAKTISTNKAWTGGGYGFTLTGDSITLGEWDAGKVRTTHQEFGSRVTSTQGTNNFHSTHVAGTMVAAGVVANAKGMSYQANLRAFDWNNDNAEMISEAAAGLRVSNHSYGFITGWDDNTFGDNRWSWWGDTAISETEDYYFGFYNENARDWDNIARNAPYYLIVQAAGNDRGEGPSGTVEHWVYINGNWVLRTRARDKDGGTSGYDCISGTALAKNILTVGAVYDITTGYSGTGSVVMSSFSGWGPTDDGRIKPDIVANGISLYSTLETSNTAYGSLSGTSMASPNAAGSLGLILQYQKKLHGTTPLRSSTLKALVLHTADEAGSNPGPDYVFGWGLMNTLKAVQLMQRDSIDGYGLHISEHLLNQDDTLRIDIQCDGSEPLRATICWTDTAGTPVAPALDPTTAMLKNDLDLRIIKKTGSPATYQPWVLNPASPSSAATTGDNVRDNVEQVHLASPEIASYTVQITHKGTLVGGSQYVSLVVSGNIPNLGPVFVASTDSLQYQLPLDSLYQDSMVVSNNGWDTLVFHTTVPDSMTGWFSVSEDSGIVLPGDSSTLHITISTASLMQWTTYTGSFELSHNDSDQSPWSVHVTLDALGPMISATPSQVIVNVDSGETGADSILVRNDGFNLLDFTIDDSSLILPPWVTINPDSATLAPGESLYVRLTLNDPSQPIDDYQTTLAIASNDSVRGTLYIQLVLHVGTQSVLYANVSARWNLISIPLEPLTSLKTALFPSASTYAFAYTGMYVRKDTLRPGVGYWLKFASGQSIPIEGYTLTENTIDVLEGWNMVGSISEPILASTITSSPPGMVTSQFFRYNGRYVTSDTLHPSQGYWVNVDQNGQLILSSAYAGMVKASTAARIQIVQTNSLPPLPPEGDVPEEVLPTRFALEQNYPNPFNPVTSFGFRLPALRVVDRQAGVSSFGFVSLKVYDVLGREVATLVDEVKQPGEYSVRWDAAGMNSGVYFYKLVAGDFVDVKKMLLIK